MIGKQGQYTNRKEWDTKVWFAYLRHNNIVNDRLILVQNNEAKAASPAVWLPIEAAIVSLVDADPGTGIEATS